MNTDEIPEEYLGDPQFVKTFISSMCREISKKEEILSDGENIITNIKETITRGLEQRAALKPMIQMEREKKCLLEPTLQSSNSSENQLTTELTIIAARLDEKSLRYKIYLEKYNDIVEMYKTTWLARQPEYEKIPAAVKRYKRRIEFRLIDIGLIMLKQKEKELVEKIKDKENIDEVRLTRKTVKMVKMILDRWEKQSIREELEKNCVQLKNDLVIMKEEKTQLLKLREEEERSKLRAKQLMPPPKLDITFMKSFYTSRLNREREAEKKRANRSPSDSDDSISVTTEILEDMCKNHDDVMEVTEESDHEGVENIARSVSGVIRAQINRENSYNENSEGVEVLEKTYRQLSLEKEPDTAENSPIEDPVVIEKSKEKKSSPLKLQSILRKPMDRPEGLSEIKRFRLEEIRETSEDEGALNEDAVDKSRELQKDQSVQRLDGGKETGEQSVKRDCPVKKDRQLPKIQLIETINRPVALGAKPLVAEVPPTPSNLFSPHHYATSSFDSIDNFDSNFNQNFDDISESENPFNSKIKMDFTAQMNWGNFSPPPALESGASFTSNISAFKNPDANTEVQQSHQQTDDKAANFFSMCQEGAQGNYFS